MIEQYIYSRSSVLNEFVRREGYGPVSYTEGVRELFGPSLDRYCKLVDNIYNDTHFVPEKYMKLNLGLGTSGEKAVIISKTKNIKQLQRAVFITHQYVAAGDAVRNTVEFPERFLSAEFIDYDIEGQSPVLKKINTEQAEWRMIPGPSLQGQEKKGKVSEEGDPFSKGHDFLSPEELGIDQALMKKVLLTVANCMEQGLRLDVVVDEKKFDLWEYGRSFLYYLFYCLSYEQRKKLTYCTLTPYKTNPVHICFVYKKWLRKIGNNVFLGDDPIGNYSVRADYDYIFEDNEISLKSKLETKEYFDPNEKCLWLDKLTECLYKDEVGVTGLRIYHSEMDRSLIPKCKENERESEELKSELSTCELYWRVLKKEHLELKDLEKYLHKLIRLEQVYPFFEERKFVQLSFESLKDGKKTVSLEVYYGLLNSLLNCDKGRKEEVYSLFADRIEEELSDCNGDDRVSRMKEIADLVQWEDFRKWSSSGKFEVFLRYCEYVLKSSEDFKFFWENSVSLENDLSDNSIDGSSKKEGEMKGVYYNYVRGCMKFLIDSRKEKLQRHELYEEFVDTPRESFSTLNSIFSEGLELILEDMSLDNVPLEWINESFQYPENALFENNSEPCKKLTVLSELKNVLKSGSDLERGKLKFESVVRDRVRKGFEEEELEVSDESFELLTFSFSREGRLDRSFGKLFETEDVDFDTAVLYIKYHIEKEKRYGISNMWYKETPPEAEYHFAPNMGEGNAILVLEVLFDIFKDDKEFIKELDKYMRRYKQDENLWEITERYLELRKEINLGLIEKMKRVFKK